MYPYYASKVETSTNIIVKHLYVRSCLYLQEVALALIYLHYIKKSSLANSGASKKTKRLFNHTVHANTLVLALDLGMLILEYIGLYSYQVRSLSLSLFDRQTCLVMVVVYIATSRLADKINEPTPCTT
jgi:hypothetical protein